MAGATNDVDFRKDVLESDVPVLVDFWAPWCGPCRMVSPIIEQVGQKTQNSARVFKVNVDENPGVAQAYGITGIPTVIVFKGGAVHRKLVGVQREQVYLDALR